ncbi:membrane protein [Philodulcilactobacillus myokoensis]|uniref:Membrane protein n=1 Tax=Philodulcilactobacillus myokoensis TaxID=2929573 RepID=A0A9W6ER17_9LACO|nr:DMT family transporter [Philodulcilactobacillus myokoensis]GLB46311.1 membrane protein [Philodulcilactobacillus myokoensis]
MKRTILYILISTLMFSLMEIALKSAGNAFSPIQLNLIRFFIGGLVLLPVVLGHFRHSHIHFYKKDLAIFALTGFLCVVVSMTLYQLAIVYDQASTVAVVFSCNPVFSLLFSFLILHETIHKLGLISMILSIVGLLVIVNPMKLTNPVGLALAIGAAITFGLYSIISRWSSVMSGFNGLTTTCFTFLAGSIELLILALISHVPMVAHGMQHVSWLASFSNTPILNNVNMHYFWLLFFISVCVTAGGFAFYFLAMDLAGVSMASLVFFIKPGLAPILAMLLIHENISINTIIGIVIILISSVVTFVGHRMAAAAKDLDDDLDNDDLA